MDKDRARTVATQVAMMFNAFNRSPTDLAIQAWVEDTEDIDLKWLMPAFKNCRKGMKQLPTIDDVREEARDIRQDYEMHHVPKLPEPPPRTTEEKEEINAMIARLIHNLSEKKGGARNAD
jgi:hypothetical protein